ncbi:MAG: arginyl-tRNA synthetase [Acidobacteriota bacterium]|jgi:arginyl-tRNA synthetase|nr:arginyl-tRNA synthetase [Acidobacteriota bacterium]
MRATFAVNLIELQTTLRQSVIEAAQGLFNVTLEQVAAEVPPRTELGDLAFPVAFELAKRIKQATGEKRAPRSLAEELAKTLETIDGVARIEVAGAGYLNVFFDRAQFLSEFASEVRENSEPSLDDRPKRMVEHTSINPNKAAHIGHVRNAVLGDTFVRILKAAGERVEVQNYIDNTGVQVADVVLGFVHIERMTLADIKTLDAQLPPDRPFDYYCWDLYTRVGRFYRHDDPSREPDPERLQLRAETIHLIEEGNNPTAELAEYVATRNVECILDTMERLEIRYDVLPRESEILRLKFWDHAFERMKETGAIHYQSEGRNKGCWVMPFESHTGTDEHEADKIIVRSNGTVTYTGKDIAYQLWKLGQLDLDFFYKPFRSYDDGHITWITTSQVQPVETCEPGESVLPHFGAGATVYNVIDSRQSYTQDIVRRGVAAVAPGVGEDASVHLAYEMVALSAAACEELGIELNQEDRARPYIEMSGRKGLGVKADDLINRLEADALREVAARHPDLTDEAKKDTAHIIAVGALRYFLLKFTRNSVIAFDFKEALSFEGETGPYCQYSAVRANSIFRKLDAKMQDDAREIIARAASGDAQVKQEMSATLDGEGGDELWSLVTTSARLDDAVSQASAAAEPAIFAKYAFNLARSFNLFYHRYRILAEENATRRAVFIAVAEVSRRQLKAGLAVLGIGVPERM